jgi:hypothetical protein
MMDKGLYQLPQAAPSTESPDLEIEIEDPESVAD